MGWAFSAAQGSISDRPLQPLLNSAEAVTISLGCHITQTEGELVMEMVMLLQEMAASLLRRPSLEGFIVWTGMVGAVIWLPSFAPTPVQGFVRHLCQAGLVGFLLAALFLPVRSTAGISSPLPLLELTALCLAATWAWLERSKDRSTFLKTEPLRSVPSSPLSSASLPSLQKSQSHPQDLLNAVRLALWLTLSLMPVVRWF